MTEFGYQDLSDIKVNTKPFKNTETIMTLTNPYNDKKIIIEYNDNGDIIRIIAPSHTNDMELIKNDNTAFLYTITESGIRLFKIRHINEHDKDIMTFTYDKNFNLLTVMFNDKTISDYTA